MRASARVVAQPDAVVLHTVGSIRLLDLLDLNNLAVSLLHLLETTQEVPEARLGHNVVGRKDGHAVEWWVWVRLVHQVTTHDAILTKLNS